METQLVKYDAACLALAEARNVDEVKEISNKAEAMRAYARQAKNKDLEVDAAEIGLRAKRRLGEIIILQKETVGLNKGSAGIGKSPSAVPEEYHTQPPTLADVGISKKLSSQSQKLAAVPVEEFEEQVAGWRENVSLENERVTTNLLARGTRAQILTGEMEWYTPGEYIHAVRYVLGGIELDPASCEFAQKVIKSHKYYTKEDDGLTQKWAGSVFLNPPFKYPLVERFVDKLLASLDSGDVPSAILLTNNATDTAWWHKAAFEANNICFTKGRISFYQHGGRKTSPTHGQTFFYYGNEPLDFIDAFSKIGMIR